MSASLAEWTESFSRVSYSIDVLESPLSGGTGCRIETTGYCRYSWGRVGPRLELALACDIRIGTENSVLVCRRPGGTMPADGGTQWLPRLVGQGKAMQMVLTASRLMPKKPAGWA